MKPREWTTIFILAVLFGSSFFFTEIARPQVGPITIAAVRLAIGGIVLGALLFSRADPVPMPTWWQMVLLGLFNSFVPITLIAWAQNELAGGVASILAATSPIFGAIFAHFFAGERLTTVRISGTIVAFVGVAFIIDPKAFLRLDVGVAPLAVLAAAMSSAAAGVFGKRVLGGASPAAAATGQVLSAALMATSLSLVVERPWERPLPGAESFAALVAMGLLSTALAYSLFFHLLEKVGAANTLLVGFLVPVCATGLGAVFLDERLSGDEVVGLVLVLASLLVINGGGIARSNMKSGSD
jgi:drug/metabolite transporter (DMT)-like permease